MPLSGSQFQQLQQALLSAFPTHSALAQVVQFGLDQNLNAIAGPGILADVVFQLIIWTQAQGKTEKLVEAAYDQNPDNPALKAYVERSRASSSHTTQSGPTPQLAPSRPSSTSSSATADAPSPVELFYSYSHKDEKLREKLETHLALLKRQCIISGWHDRRIGAGQEWANQIDQHLNTAQIILLLISADFLASDYCYEKELMRAMERHETGEATVIPIILRPCDWHTAPFGKLQALPKDAKPIKQWTDKDEAFLDVTQGIRLAAEDINRQSRQTKEVYRIKSERIPNVSPKPLREGGRLHYYVQVSLIADANTLLSQIRTVEYLLDPSFSPPIQRVENSRKGFSLRLWTYGFFDIQATLFMHDGSTTSVKGKVEFAKDL